MAEQAQKAIVIGSGIAGLASAVRLRNLGYQVTVLEAWEVPGGKVGEWRSEGFRFDMGPSLFTLPGLLDELFRQSGKNPADYYDYSQLEVICRYFWNDGTELDAHADPEKLAQEFEEKLGEPAENIRKHLQKAKEIYELTNPVFLEGSLHDWSTYKKAASWKVLTGMGVLDPFRTLHKANKRRFQSPKSVQLFDRYATYNGSNPYKAPATLNVISHLEHDMGAWLLRGGMRALVNALCQLGQDLGVEYRFGAKVDSIETSADGRQVTGVKSGKEFWPADVVVSGADVVPTYRKLLPQAKQPERTLNRPKSTSALIFYWGVEGTYPDLDVHNILFAEDYPAEFRALTETGRPYEDPTIYMYISSKHESADAPEGCENWFVMINVPHDSGQDWMDFRQKARAAILSKIEKQLGESISTKIRTEFVLDPPGIESKTSSHRGALYGNSSDDPLAAFLRHPNFSRRIRGLYFAGGSVHPGGGIPLCLLGARIVGDLVERREVSPTSAR